MKEDDLRNSSIPLDDLNSKTTDEIIDGLVRQAKGDKELALKNLENYMSVNDGFNRNVILAHQELKKTVESMKNSKFNKMVEETLTNLTTESRQEQINDIVDTYVRMYTCAQMADRLYDVNKETKEANEYIENKIAELNITKEELNIGMELAYDDIVNKNKSAFCYDSKYFRD